MRCFEIPPLNFSASDYMQLVNLDEISCTEPPVLMDLADEDIESLIEECSPFKLTFPCHTQAVEKMVKEVTQVPRSVTKEEERHFHIVKKLGSRRKMPTFVSKSHFRF